jgi:hypothetical protein
MTQLDHIMYACPDLQAGIDEIYALTGVMPAMGGSHPGVGTRNALLSLDNHQYLEIIAPDPEQDLAGTTGQLLLDHGGTGIRSWAIACDSLTKVATLAAARNITTRDIIDMSRTTPDGVKLAWQLLFLTDPHMPFFIDWLKSPHPALSTPTGCQLKSFHISATEAETYQDFLTDLALPLTATAGANAFTAELETPKGSVLLNSW